MSLASHHDEDVRPNSSSSIYSSGNASLSCPPSPTEGLSEDGEPPSPPHGTKRGAGGGPETTRLVGSGVPASQDVFAAIIKTSHAGQRELHDMFTFSRTAPHPSKLMAACGGLTRKQHDCMCVLAGCTDVCYMASRVKPKVLAAVTAVYGIGKHPFSLWFRNQRSAGNPRAKFAAAAAAAEPPSYGLQQQSTSVPLPLQQGLLLPAAVPAAPMPPQRSLDSAGGGGSSGGGGGGFAAQLQALRPFHDVSGSAAFAAQPLSQGLFLGSSSQKAEAPARGGWRPEAGGFARQLGSLSAPSALSAPGALNLAFASSAPQQQPGPGSGGPMSPFQIAGSGGEHVCMRPVITSGALRHHSPSEPSAQIAWTMAALSAMPPDECEEVADEEGQRLSGNVGGGGGARAMSLAPSFDGCCAGVMPCGTGGYGRCSRVPSLDMLDFLHTFLDGPGEGELELAERGPDPNNRE